MPGGAPCGAGIAPAAEGCCDSMSGRYLVKGGVSVSNTVKSSEGKHENGGRMGSILYVLREAADVAVDFL